MSSALHQSNTSPYNKCHQSYLSELTTFTNPAFPNSLWGVEDNYLTVDNTTQHGEDFVVPDSSDVFLFSDHNHNHFGTGFQLPMLQQEYTNYFSVGGFDGPGTEYFMHAAENGLKDDHMIIQDYGTSFASAYNHFSTLGKATWQEIQCQRNQQGSTPNTRVGRYSAEERRDRILRYLKKRNQRNFNKTIKYACRKTLADRRIRVRGRFAKNTEEVEMKRNNGGTLEETTISPSSYYDYADDHFHQMKQDGEEWLQEAISSLMYNISTPYNYVPQWQGGLPLQ